MQTFLKKWWNVLPVAFPVAMSMATLKVAVVPQWWNERHNSVCASEILGIFNI